MNKAVELMAEWGKFEVKHPGAELEDFCRSYLEQKSATAKAVAKPAWTAPASTDFALMRLIGRIVKLQSSYAITAMAGSGINTIEEFSLMNAIYHLNEPRKKDAISTALFELTTGTSMLERLAKAGMITEYADKEDGRSKRVKITAKGNKALLYCRKQMELLAQMEFYDLTAAEKKTCISLLNGIDTKFSARWLLHKGKSFETVYHEMTAGRSSKG